MDGGARRFVEDVAFGPGAWDQLPPQAQATFLAVPHMTHPDDYVRLVSTFIS